MHHYKISVVACSKIDIERRWIENEILIIALNFSEGDKQVPIPFGHAGTWVDILEKEFKGAENPCSITVEDPAIWTPVAVPRNFGRIFQIML